MDDLSVSTGAISAEDPLVEHMGPSRTSLSELMMPDLQPMEPPNMNDEDYSTDSSIGGRPQQQLEVRQPSRRRRPPRLTTNREEREATAKERVTVLPELYRHSNRPPPKVVWSNPLGLYPSDHLQESIEDITTVNLEGLVKYSSFDLLSRAWPLVPSSVKNFTYAPFAQLPELPEIVNVRHPDTDQVAHFMRLAAIEIAKRQTSPTPVFLRSLLVSAAANLEAEKSKDISLSMYTYPEDSLLANWETEDNVDTNEEDDLSLDTVIMSSTDASEVDPLDWTIALLSQSLQPRIPLRVLSMLHVVLNRCGIHPLNTTLMSWGVQYLTRLLLLQLEKESSAMSETGGDNNWLKNGIALLFKILLATKKVDIFLSLLRWIYKRQNIVGNLALTGLETWVTAIEAYSRPRMRLPFTVSSIKASWVPLGHSVGLEFLRNVVGLCVIQNSDESQGVLFSKQGIYKVDLKPPYCIISESKNSRLSSCRGVFIEGDSIAVQYDRANVVGFYDIETLQEKRVMEIGEGSARKDFRVYTGFGNLVTPHYFHDSLTPKYACFYPLTFLKGIMEPSTIAIPTTTDSLSVQFYLCPRYTPQNTTMELIQINVSSKVWLSVKLSINSMNSTLSIVFEHGDGIIAEVHERLQEKWTLWSACMYSINDVATWSVYRDGVLFERVGMEGTIFKPSVHTASIKFLHGTFSGFISGFQLWCKSQTEMELLRSATGELSDRASSTLLCFFKMNEGSGCCFRNSTGCHLWRGTAPMWCAPEKTPFTGGTEKSEVIPYLPSEDYYITTSECETIIVENGFCTWINRDGLILEQQFFNVSPSELHFFCTHTSRLYSMILKKNGLQWIQTPFPPTKYLKELPSVRNAEHVSATVLALARGKKPLALASISEYVLHRVNGAILSNFSGDIRTHGIEQFFSWIYEAPVSPRTVSRLVDICVELIGCIGSSSSVESEFTHLLLCVCGRLLTKQLSKMGRGCPSKLGRVVVGMYKSVNELESTIKMGNFLPELQSIFSHLHHVFLIECVSNEYQLERIMEAKKLIDVKELLVPDYLPSLVTCMIDKKDKKPFMTFLGRLKDECLAESELVFSGRCASYKPSAAALVTLLGALSQTKNTQWHLVVVALMSSLCKGILRTFDRRIPSSHSSKKRTAEELEVLKQTFIGVVVFPLAHFISNVEFDSDVAVDVLTLLNEMREMLILYSPQTVSQSVTHSFTEPHKITTSVTSTCTTRLDLRYAQNIEVSYEHSRTDDSPQVMISLLKNDYTRVTEALNECMIFNSGGQLEISCNSTAEDKETVVNVNAHVELETVSTHWIHDICFALSHAIIRITHQLLLADLPDAIIFPRESLFRGGVSQAALQEHHVHTTAEERVLDRTEQMKLIQLCEEATTPTMATATTSDNLLSEWKTLYAARRIPHQERLEPVLRWFCAAHVWHSHRPRSVTLKEALSETLDLLRKKAFLILEAVQQGHEGVMLDRARFLLKMVNPRSRLEAILAEYEQTEEPVTSTSRSPSTRVMPNVRSIASVASFSRDRTESRNASFMRRVATTSSDISVLHQDNVGSVSRPRTSLLGAGVVSEGTHCSPESISSQILGFLLHGYGKYNNEQLLQAMVIKAQHAAMHAAAYKLQEELCSAHQFDECMASSIVCSHLLYRELAHLQYNDSKEDAEGGTRAQVSSTHYKTSENLQVESSTDHHYIELMIGCGFQRELELQRASCSFVHSAIQNLLNQCEDEMKTDQEVVKVISLCAILCHPWDSVDMSIIHPAKIFRVLKKYIFASIYATVPDLQDSPDSSSNDAESCSIFTRERGIFSLLTRAVFIPNSLQPSADRVSIVEGDTLGIHVEDADVWCLARNHWPSLRSDARWRKVTSESDYLADFASGCVIADIPEVLYFEVTLELALNEKALVSMGLSNAQFPSPDGTGKENSIFFSSDGLVKYKNSPNRFSCHWAVGDVIGCGVLAPLNSVFFTRNGVFLGIAASCTFTTMKPFIDIQATSTFVKLVVNFGEQSPFKFDIASLHSSSRTRLTSPAMLADCAFVTAHYLVTLCFNNLLRHERSESTVNPDSVCALLEAAAVFLREIVLELVRHLKQLGVNGGHCKNNSIGKSLQNGSILLARLFRTVGIVTDCFRFDAVTNATHLEILRLCSVTLIDAHDRWVKVRAARCIGNVSRILRQDYFGEAVQGLQCYVTPDVIVNSLTELARGKVCRERELSIFTPQWKGGLTTVHGKGVFYGSSPMPSKGTHMVGFRIRRRQQDGRGHGAPLGGCYYVGLAHGNPSISNMSHLIARNDVYVLQDTDDNDQVAHLLLRRHYIPRSGQRRIYGNDEIVWVEFNADAGEITYYRDNMILIGLAFAYIQSRDDLYPMVFHFNEDASCELIQAPTPYEDPCELRFAALRRSTAVHTLQQLHIAPFFSVAVSQWVYRFLTRSYQNLENCLVALAILGGEKSSEFCHHETYGAVIVDAVSVFASKAIVYLEADGDMRLFSTSLSSLSPSFVRPPLFSLSDGEGLNSAKQLISELSRSLYEASVIIPLINFETQQRMQIEKDFTEKTTEHISLDYMSFLRLSDSSRNIMGACTIVEEKSIYAIKPSTSSSFLRILENGKQSTSGTPVVIDKRLSTSSIFTPNPSIGITSGSGYSVIRGNILLENTFSFAVSFTTPNPDSLLYVGVSSETRLIVEPQKVSRCSKTWALCSSDTLETNSVNCSVEPGMIFSAEQILFNSGDVILVQVNRSEKTASFSRLRGGRRVNFGILFESIPINVHIRPFVLAPAESTVIFSFLDGHTFPVRQIFSLNNSITTTWKSNTRPKRCISCETENSVLWYEGDDDVRLCSGCFNSWQYPQMMFRISRPEAPLPDYIVSRHCPKELAEESLVMFTENPVLTWSVDHSVNVDIEGSTCMAKSGTAFATLKSLAMIGDYRVDVSLTHVAGVNGFPFGGLLPFSPSWRVGSVAAKSSSINGGSLLISSTVIPHNTKVIFGLEFTSAELGHSLNTSGIFVGVTNLPCSYGVTSNVDLEHRIASHNIWGTWCDTDSKISASKTVYVLVDMTRGLVSMSSSLLGINLNPFVVTSNCFIDEEETHLRIAIFSRDQCQVTFIDGFVSLNEMLVEPSPSPIGIGIAPEDGIRPGWNNQNTSCFLLDSIGRTATDSAWKFTQLVKEEGMDILFAIGDILTVFQEKQHLSVYRNGLLIATRLLSDEFLLKPHRLFVYLSTRGMIAKTVPPLYGRYHLAKIIRNCGADVGIVECLCPCQEGKRYAVRRKDVRYCALAVNPANAEVGASVAFKPGTLHAPRRGIITSIENNTVNVRDTEDKRAWLSVEMSSLYLLGNEGPDLVPEGLYPLMAPPPSMVTRVFEVGKTKYRLQQNDSYNGIIFDCQAHETIVLTGLSVLTHTSGRHRVDVYFKKGSHHTYERDPSAWTRIFSNLVEMRSKGQFTVTFPGIQVEVNTTFALYINASHNCGVGHYSKDDGCTGSISTKLDGDGIITVFIGRASESSTAFSESSATPRGFCGSLIYARSNDTQQSFMGVVSSSCFSESAQMKSSAKAGELMLRSCPSATRAVSSVEFIVEVFESPITIRKLFLPILFRSNGFKQLIGPAHVQVSIFYSVIDELKDVENSERNWIWFHHEIISLHSRALVLRIEDIHLFLKKGTYIFTATCNDIAENMFRGNTSNSLVELLEAVQHDFSVRNNFFSVRRLAGDIYASTVDKVIISDSLCKISTGSHLNQSNSASYNGIMFDIRSKYDILLEEVFCVAQTNSDNVNVTVFWREGSLQGVEKDPSQWRQIATKNMYLADKQYFSAGPLNVQLRAKRVYSLYINTTSSCGVRFYNCSDGHVGDVGEEFEDDGVLTIFVGKKSESPKAFLEIPTDPRAIRGRITYRRFLRTPPSTQNQAVFPAFKGFVVARILAALISYFGGTACDTALFDEKYALDNLVKLAASTTNVVCCPEAVGNILDSIMKGSALEDLRNGFVTIPLSTETNIRFDSFSKGDLAVVARGTTNDVSTGQLVRLLEDPDENYHVKVKNLTPGGSAILKIGQKNILPIIECPYCHDAFAVKSICTKTGKPHLPPQDEEGRLVNIFTRYLSQRCVLNSETINTRAKSLVRNPEALHTHFFDSQCTTPKEVQRLAGESLDSQSTLYTVPLDLLVEGRKGDIGRNFVLPFVYNDFMNAFVSLSFTYTSGAWKITLFTDLPLRTSETDIPRVLEIQLQICLNDGTYRDLTASPILYFVVRGGPVLQELLNSEFSLHYTCLQYNGMVRFKVEVREGHSPPPTPLIVSPAMKWLWSTGSNVMDLQPGKVCRLKDEFSAWNWPKNKPRFWQLKVTSKSNDVVFFMEVQVFIPHFGPMVFWDVGKPCLKNRRSISISRDEELTLAFTVDNDFVIYDEEDTVRCHIPLDHLNSTVSSSRSVAPTVAFVNVGQHTLTARLHALSAVNVVGSGIRESNVSCPWAAEPKTYSPEWVSYDSRKLKVSSDKLRASCNGESGLAVIGSQLPMTGLSAFVIQIDRSDRARGDPLGSGHFAGIAVSTFDQFSLHFGMLRKEVDSIWAVQDVYDIDSLPTQERIPQVNSSDRSGEMFSVGTKLRFLVDRDNGTLSLARDNESPRVVFRNIPCNVPLSPFVRLDHAKASATLAPFSCALWGDASIFTSPSLVLSSQSVRPTILRQFPYTVVVAMYPVFCYVMRQLPLDQINKIENIWSNRVISTREDYILSMCLQRLVESGTFSRQMKKATKAQMEIFCSKREIQEILLKLSKPPEQSLVVLSKKDGDEFNAVLPLPRSYELLGRVKDSQMYQLLYFDRNGLIERTLHVFHVDNLNIFMQTKNVVTKHPCVMHQVELVQSLSSNSSVCGVITEGWYDTTLNCMRVLTKNQQRFIAKALTGALEHWHLHFLPHGHVVPENIYLRIDHGSFDGDIIVCSLWNTHYLNRHHPCASPGLRLYGIRDMKGDNWSYAHILSGFTDLIEGDPKFRSALELMGSEFSLSQVVDLTGVLNDQSHETTLDNPVLCLRTGAHHDRGSASYHGIMFDVIAKRQKTRLIKLTFIPDTTSLVQVTLFVHEGSFMGVETVNSAWRVLAQQDRELVDGEETEISGFEPVEIPAGGRVALFLHTTSGSGVLFYSEADGIKENMGVIEEENDDIGITVGKKSESITPFVDIQGQKRFFKGSISYTLPMHIGELRSRLIINSEGVCSSFEESVRKPVFYGTQPGLVLEECKGDCLVYCAENQCQWVAKHLLQEVDFVKYPALEDLEKKLQMKIREERYETHEFSSSTRRMCSRGLHFSRGTDADGRIWLISEPISWTCMITTSLQNSQQSTASLFVVSTLKGTTVDYKHMDLLTTNGTCTIYIDLWRRSVFSSEAPQSVVKKLYSDVSSCPLHLVFGPSVLDVNEMPLSAIVTMQSTHVTVSNLTQTISLLELHPKRHLNETCILNGIMLRCHAELPSDLRKLQGASFPLWYRDVCITTLPDAVVSYAGDDLSMKDDRDNDIEANSGITRFLVDVQPRLHWMDETVTFEASSTSLEIDNKRVQQISHGGPYTCAVTHPIFEGSKAHEVEFLVMCPTHCPLRVSFKHAITNWSFALTIPMFSTVKDVCDFPYCCFKCIRVFLRVIPGSKRVFLSVDNGVFFNVVSLVDCPGEFQLEFSFSAPGSTIELLHWRVCDGGEPVISRESMEMIWKQLRPIRISPTLPNTVGVLARHSKFSIGTALSRGDDTSLVSQIEGVIVTYARQLLGTLILTSRSSLIRERLQDVLPFTPLRNDMMALDGLVVADAKKSSFQLVATSYAYLATPTIAQNVGTVEVSVNIIWVALASGVISPLLSSAFGPTLMLLLLHIATVYTRSIRHTSLRCILKLLNTSNCNLPSHEALSVAFAPLLGMMNGLCRKGRLSSVIVQLGISLICEFTRRYHLERPMLAPPGKKSAVPYTIARCIKVAIDAITSNPPAPLPEALAQESKEVHTIQYKICFGHATSPGVIPCHAVFVEPFQCTFGSKVFEVLLSSTRSGNVVVGWDMDAVLHGSLLAKQATISEGQSRTLLPSCGYSIDPNGKIFILLSRKRESQPLKVRAKGGDVLIVKSLYHEQAVVIQLKRGTRIESSTRFETYPNEMLALPVFFSENKDDATFNGSMLSGMATGLNVTQLYDRLLEYPDSLDTAVIPQPYEFYAELALFCQHILKPEQKSMFLTYSPEKDSLVCPSHDLAGFPILSSYLGASAFSSEVPLADLIPYVKRLKVFDALTSVFSVVVDLRRKTELFDLWKKLKNLCSVESAEKIQNETMRPFRNRVGKKANVIIHTMQARPSARLGPYPTLMRSIFGQLFVQLQRSPIETFYASPMFTVKLAGFGSTDAGGPYRDVLSHLAAEIMTTHPSGTFQLNPLFVQCGRGGQSAVMPNVIMSLKTQSPYMFEFFGKLLALCFVTKDLLAVEFPPLFWKLLLSEETDVQDLKSIDPDITRQLTPEELMDLSVDELEERFPGIGEFWELYCAENADLNLEQKIPPTDPHSIKLLADQIIAYELQKYDPAINSIRHGFDEVVPLYTLSAFRWQQVELVICGTPKLSFEALRDACEIHLPSAGLDMFLDVLKNMTDEDRMLLLRFTTGQTRLPLKEAIKVQHNGTLDSLPTSSTCFFTLRLPTYSSTEAMREKILYAIRQCKAIDTDGLPREHIILDN